MRINKKSETFFKKFWRKWRKVHTECVFIKWTSKNRILVYRENGGIFYWKKTGIEKNAKDVSRTILNVGKEFVIYIYTIREKSHQMEKK